MHTPTNRTAQHYWVDAPSSGHRAAIIAGLALAPSLLAVTSAHRRLRGPYTAAGTIMRAVAADALERFPALVAAHEIEILCVAPELRERIPATHETLTSPAIPEERTRFYSRLKATMTKPATRPTPRSGQAMTLPKPGPPAPLSRSRRGIPASHSTTSPAR
jgi:hypothetical protein